MFIVLSNELIKKCRSQYTTYMSKAINSTHLQQPLLPYEWLKVYYKDTTADVDKKYIAKEITKAIKCFINL